MEEEVSSSVSSFIFLFSHLSSTKITNKDTIYDIVYVYRLAIMLIPKKNRKLIYEHLFKEGVMVAKKDFNLPKHPDIDVPNLHVIKALQVCI